MRSAFRSPAKRVTATVPDAICQSRSVPLIAFGRRETRRTHDEKLENSARNLLRLSQMAVASYLLFALTASAQSTKAVKLECGSLFHASGDGRPAAHVVMENPRFTSWSSFLLVG
jgi:hypothetical protein